MIENYEAKFDPSRLSYISQSIRLYATMTEAPNTAPKKILQSMASYIASKIPRLRARLLRVKRQAANDLDLVWIERHQIAIRKCLEYCGLTNATLTINADSICVTIEGKSTYWFFKDETVDD